MWRGEHGPRAFQAPVDVHASADGQVYMFRRRPNESTASSDDEELTLMEMRPRVYPEQEQDRLRSIQLLEREVTDGDNLNKLALQYGCKVKISFHSWCYNFFMHFPLQNKSPGIAWVQWIYGGDHDFSQLDKSWYLWYPTCQRWELEEQTILTW